MFVYISESEKFVDFDNSDLLYWSLKNIEYGDWEFGENKDGTSTFKNQIQLTEVLFLTKKNFQFIILFFKINI